MRITRKVERTRFRASRLRCGSRGTLDCAVSLTLRTTEGFCAIRERLTKKRKFTSLMFLPEGGFRRGPTLIMRLG